MNSSENGKILLTSYLQKRSKILHIWRRRFCVLTERYILTYKGTVKESESTESINLSECRAINDSDNSLGKANTFELVHKDRSYYFMCRNKEEQEEWIQAIEQIIELNNENKNDDNNNKINEK